MGARVMRAMYSESPVLFGIPILILLPSSCGNNVAGILHERA